MEVISGSSSDETWSSPQAVDGNDVRPWLAKESKNSDEKQGGFPPSARKSASYRKGAKASFDGRTEVADTFEHNSHLIDQCLMVIFIMSQTSLQSIDCADEVHYAYESRKRFLKIVYQKKPLEIQGSMAMMLQSCDSVSFCHVDPMDLPDTDSHWMRLFASVFQGLTQRPGAADPTQEVKEEVKVEEKAEPEEGKAVAAEVAGELLDRGSFPTSDSDDEANIVAEQNERTKSQNTPNRAFFSLTTKARSRKRVIFDDDAIHQPTPTPPTSILSAIIGRGSTSTPFTPAREEKTDEHHISIPMELFSVSPILLNAVGTQQTSSCSPATASSPDELEGLLSHRDR